MLFVVHALDKPGNGDQRKTYNPEHQKYLDEANKAGVTIVMSGPLLGDNGATVIGSHLVLEAANIAVIKKFHHNDPFFKAGVWQPASIATFKKTRG